MSSGDGNQHTEPREVGYVLLALRLVAKLSFFTRKNIRP